MNPLRCVAFWFATILAVIGYSSALGAGPQKSKDGPFDEVPAPFDPKRPRTEADQDRVAAAALFTHGRLLLQRQDYSGALKKFQRAARCDPDSVVILEEIVPLAFELKRNDVAARYAVIAAEKLPRDASLLVQLASYVAEQKDWERALRLYQQALRLAGSEPDRGAGLLIHLEMGRLYFLTEQFTKSASSFVPLRDFFREPDKVSVPDALKKILLEKPERTLALMAEAFFQAAHYDDAAAVFRQIHEYKKNEDWLAYELARVETEQGAYAAALEKLERYLDANLSEAGVEPFELLARLLRKTMPDEQAANVELRRRLAELRKKYPDNLPLGFALADQFRTDGELAAAEEVFLDLLKRQPATDVFQGLVDIYRAQGRAEELLKVLGEASLKLGSLEPLGKSLTTVVEDASLVQKLLDLVQQGDPAKLPGGAALAAAQVALSAKQFDAADKCYELALQSATPPKAQVMGSWGVGMFAAAQADRAARIFQRMIDEKVKPEENYNYYYFLAGALTLADRTDDALAAAKRALGATPKSARLQSRLAWILYHAKRFPDAEQNYLDLLKEFDADHTSPETREILRESRLALSNICVHTQRLPQAEEWLEQVLDEFPEDIGAWNDLGYLWADQNKHLGRSLIMVQKAVAKEPKNKAYRDSLGWVYYRLGKFEQAVQELQLAAESESPDGVIMDHLGDARWKANQPEQALAAWKQAVEFFEKENEPEKARKTTAKIDERTQP